MPYPADPNTPQSRLKIFLRSLDSWSVCVRCGFMSLAAHIRWTLTGGMQATRAMLGSSSEAVRYPNERLGQGFASRFSRQG